MALPGACGPPHTWPRKLCAVDFCLYSDRNQAGRFSVAGVAVESSAGGVRGVRAARIRAMVAEETKVLENLLISVT